MDAWTDTVLGDVLTLQRGFDLAERQRVPGNIPIVSSSGVSGYHSIAKVKAPGVVTGRYGTLGEVFYVNVDFWPLNTTLWVKDFKGNHPRFVSYLLQTLNLAHQNAAGAVPGVNRNALHLLPVRLPPIETQERISDTLSAYDRLIENNTRRIKILEEMAQMLYREWFVNFRFPGHDNVGMVESQLGPIPEGWGIRPLPDLCSKVIDGTHDSPPPVEDGFFLVTGKHFTSGFINFDACYRISPDEHEKVMRRSKPEPGDILFSNIGTLGSIALVPKHRNFSIKNVALFKPKTPAHSTFLYCHFRLPDSLEVLHQKASGTSQKFWSLHFLRSLPLVEPPEMLMSLFHHHVEPLLTSGLLLNDKNINLRTTRDFLLPKLISGEVSVEAAAELALQPA